MTLTIVAADLTGACDTGTLFARAEPVSVTVWPGVSSEGGVRVVDTETRALSADLARDRVHRVAVSPGDRYFKKIDSTLRGHVGAEVDALMTASGARSALVCPAFPSQGRVVLDGVLLIHGTPLIETTLARAREFPRGRASTSNVLDLLRPETDRPLAWISITEVRAGAGALASRLSRLAGMVSVADALTDTDLEALVDAVLTAAPSPLLVGSAGLARALAARLDLLADDVPMPAVRRWLIVAGSLHPASRRQIVAARRAGLPVLATPETGEADARVVAAQLAEEAARRLSAETFDIVAVTGGDTAVALYRALGADRIDLVGAPAPGLALGHLRAPGHPDLWLLTKAGGFGEPDLFVTLAKEAA